jgi:hypothetical protein
MSAGVLVCRKISSSSRDKGPRNPAVGARRHPGLAQRLYAPHWIVVAPGLGDRAIVSGVGLEAVDGG